MNQGPGGRPDRVASKESREDGIPQQGCPAVLSFLRNPGRGQVHARV